MSFGDSEYLYLLSHPPESELSRWQTRLENDGLGETSGVRILRSPPIGFYSKLIEKSMECIIFIRNFQSLEIYFSPCQFVSGALILKKYRGVAQLVARGIW